MRRSLRAGLLVAVLALFGACSGAFRAKFPTEDEVRGKLQKGMTAEEVLAAFGEPPGHQWVDVKRGGKVHYIAPVAARRRRAEGYAGFTVYFDRGKVWDWEVIRMNPSYEHRVLPPLAGWVIGLVGLVVAGLAGYTAFRILRARREEEDDLRNAYAARQIATAELPADFRFVTHSTTLASVVERAGPYSRTRQIPLTDDAGQAPLTAAEYELPGRGGVIVIPEQPFAPDSCIRAVYYRRPRAEAEI